MNDELGYIWLTEIYHPESLKRVGPGEPRLLILDGHASHVNLRFIQICDGNDIVLYCLTPDSTQIRQPLDVGLFSPEKVEMILRTTG